MAMLDMRKLFEIKNVRAQYSGAQTAQIVIAAPSAKTRIAIDKVAFSASTIGDVIFLSGSTPIGPRLYHGARGGFVVDDLSLFCGYAEDFAITTTATGIAVLYVEYHLEGGSL